MFDGTVIIDDLDAIIEELGHPLRHLRPDGASAYDSSKTYQNLQGITMVIDETINGIWSLEDSALVLAEWGLIRPDAISIVVPATVDIREDDLIVHNSLLYMVVHTKNIVFAGTVVAKTSELSEKVGTTV